MINLNTFIQAKHIKIIHKIINSETQHWDMIGKHWLKYLDKTYNSENFLYHCSNTKGIQINLPSQFYKDAVQSWVSLKLRSHRANGRETDKNYFIRSCPVVFVLCPFQIR